MNTEGVLIYHLVSQLNEIINMLGVRGVHYLKMKHWCADLYPIAIGYVGSQPIHIQTVQDIVTLHQDFPGFWTPLACHINSCVDANFHTYLIILFPLWYHSLITGGGKHACEGSQTFLGHTWRVQQSLRGGGVKRFSQISLSYLLVIVYF